MADEKEKTSGGFLKAIMSSAVGLVSGAVIMYVSPLVNSAIKPPKPVPNFSFALEGVTATFNNRSTGGTQGWWDFGDGSALEAFAPNQASVTHKFPGPGSYTIKLSLHNLIGEEAERTAPVKIESQMPPPTIDDFQVTAVTTNRSGSSAYPTAPATFRITGKLKNADLLFWSIDDQPLELLDPAPGSLEHYVTFASYGPKRIRLMAVSGKNKIEMEKGVWVDVPDDEPMFLIQQASYAATAKRIPISVSIPAQFNGAVYPFEEKRRVANDTTILDATINYRPSDKLVRNPKLTISPDKKGFTVSGDLVRQSGAVPASWMSTVELKVANHGVHGTKRSDSVSATLKLPGQTLVNLPVTADGMVAGLEWTILQGTEEVYKDTKAPVTQMMQLKEKMYRVTVTPVGGQIQVDVADAAGTPFLNTSSPRK